MKGTSDKGEVLTAELVVRGAPATPPPETPYSLELLPEPILRPVAGKEFEATVTVTASPSLPLTSVRIDGQTALPLWNGLTIVVKGTSIEVSGTPEAEESRDFTVSATAEQPVSSATLTITVGASVLDGGTKGRFIDL